MNKLVKDAIILGSIGFVAGLLVSFVIYFFSGALTMEGPNNVSTTRLALKILVGGLQGALAMSTTVFYSIESWSLLMATLTHFVVTMAGLMIMASIQGWLNFADRTFILILILMLIIYALIWVLQYISYRRTLKEMNEEIHRIKRK